MSQCVFHLNLRYFASVSLFGKILLRFVTDNGKRTTTRLMLRFGSMTSTRQQYCTHTLLWAAATLDNFARNGQVVRGSTELTVAKET